ncbi:hypothetical protein ACLB2K_027046 [Fragaria x ananassa]
MSTFEFINTCSKENMKTKSDGVLKWTHPPEGVTTINCDAAWSDENNGGLGVVLCNHEGDCIRGAHGQASLPSVKEDEATTNSTLLAHARIGRFTQIIDDIKWKKKFVNSITWDWIPREAHQVANAAALLGKRMMGLNRWVNWPPSSLSNVLRNDGLP